MVSLLCLPLAARVCLDGEATAKGVKGRGVKMSKKGRGVKMSKLAKVAKFGGGGVN
jgi:hypothetical protein